MTGKDCIQRTAIIGGTVGERPLVRVEVTGNRSQSVGLLASANHIVANDSQSGSIINFNFESFGFQFSTIVIVIESFHNKVVVSEFVESSGIGLLGSGSHQLTIHIPFISGVFQSDVIRFKIVGHFESHLGAEADRRGDFTIKFNGKFTRDFRNNYVVAPSRNRSNRAVQTGFHNGLNMPVVIANHILSESDGVFRCGCIGECTSTLEPFPCGNIHHRRQEAGRGVNLSGQRQGIIGTSKFGAGNFGIDLQHLERMHGRRHHGAFRN